MNLSYIPTVYPWDQTYSPGSVQNVSNGLPYHAADTSELFPVIPAIPLADSKPHVNLEKMSNQLPGLYGQLVQNPEALSCLTKVVNLLQQGFWPEKHHLNGLVDQFSNDFRCVVPNCEKYVNGFDREDRAREHFVIAHLGGAYQCPLCPITCARSYDLAVHYQNLHSEAPTPRIPCTVCNKTFPKKGNLNRHLEEVHGLQPDRRLRRAS